MNICSGNLTVRKQEKLLLVNLEEEVEENKDRQNQESSG